MNENTELVNAIQSRIQLNETEGVQLLEGQLLPHGISLEVACTLAEYLERNMNTAAKNLIQSLDSSMWANAFNIYSNVWSIKNAAGVSK